MRENILDMSELSGLVDTPRDRSKPCGLRQVMSCEVHHVHEQPEIARSRNRSVSGVQSGCHRQLSAT